MPQVYRISQIRKHVSYVNSWVLQVPNVWNTYQEPQKVWKDKTSSEAICPLIVSVAIERHAPNPSTGSCIMEPNRGGIFKWYIWETEGQGQESYTISARSSSPGLVPQTLEVVRHRHQPPQSALQKQKGEKDNKFKNSNVTTLLISEDDRRLRRTAWSGSFKCIF